MLSQRLFRRRSVPGKGGNGDKKDDGCEGKSESKKISRPIEKEAEECKNCHEDDIKSNKETMETKEEESVASAGGECDGGGEGGLLREGDEAVGGGGARIVAVDLQLMAPLPGVVQIHGDITKVRR